MNKACPVVLRRGCNGIEFLVFESPLAGKQLIKGTIEAGESLGKACARELEEESGVQGDTDQIPGSMGCKF
jgi:8-oxo-dGTP pyrophosphatase MutT (NUDIX family)